MKTKYLIVAALEEESQGLFEKLPNSDVLYTGVGKLNAAINLMFCPKIEIYKAIINLGTVGCRFHTDIGKILQISNFIQNDIDPNFARDSDHSFSMKILTRQFQTRICGTQDIFTEGFENYHLNDLADMEGFALARVTEIFRIPFLSLKFGSDSGSLENWKKSLPEASQALYEAGLKLIQELDEFPTLQY